MSAIDGALSQDITESGLIYSGSGIVYGVTVNSHTSGTLKLGDGTNGTFATLASQTLTSDATNVSDGETCTIGSIVYRFKTSIAQAYDILIGASAAATLDNLKDAINGSGTVGTTYYAGTYPHPKVVATTNTNTTQVVVARAIGTDGAAIGTTEANAIATTETSAHLSWGAATLAGGVAGARLLNNTITFASGPGFYLFPHPEIFGTGLYALVGGTLDATIHYRTT